MLACWSALWHPRLLSATRQLPRRWTATKSPPLTDDTLLAIPAPSEANAESDLHQFGVNDAVRRVQGFSSRATWEHAFLDCLEDDWRDWHDEAAADFLALGYCFLQVELLTQKLQYSSTLDRGFFQQQAVAAADALLAGNHAEVRERLVKCFDALAQARDHYYPVEAYVVDLLLVAPSTMGSELIRELEASSPKSLLISASTVEQMSEHSPEALTALRRSLESGTVTLVGGEYEENPLPHCSMEAILQNLQRGLATYQRLLGQRPNVFGRRQFGLTTRLPQMLEKLGFTGVLHATLDDGQFPRADESKFYWEGIDGSTIEAFGRIPVDASSPETFLYYADRLGDAMNLDHLASVCLAHWPGQAADYCDDLRRISQYVPVLGKFVTLDEYLQDTDYAAHGGRFSTDQYRSPYLRQSVDAGEAVVGPITGWVERYQRDVQKESEVITQSLLALLPSASGEQSKPPHQVSSGPDDTEEVQGASGEKKHSAAHAVAEALTENTADPAKGVFLWNPFAFSRRERVKTDGQMLSTNDPCVYSATNEGKRQEAVVDVPAVGFVWSPYTETVSSSSQRSRPLAEGDVLRNEHMEVLIDPEKGTLKAIYDFVHRGNRLSQQLAVRQVGGQQKPYTAMVADRVAITCASAVLGEITCDGRLVDRHGVTQARFRQVYRLARGSRVLSVDLTVQDVCQLGDDPWQSYLGMRFAWSQEAALLYRDLAWSRQSTDADRFQASSYVEIDTADGPITILTGGLPFHCRSGSRHLDTLAVVKGEQCRQFRFGIGVDLTHALPHAIGFVAPLTSVPDVCGPPRSAGSGWFVHADVKNVQLTYLKPLWENDRLCGFCTRVLETEGRQASCRLSFFRTIAQAEKTNFEGQQMVDCAVEDGAVRLEMSAHEFAQVVARW